MNSNEEIITDRKRDTVYEVGLNLIPYIGGSLSALYTSRRDKIKFQRIADFYETVSKKIKELDEAIQTKIESQQHDDDSLMLLIEKINDQVERENLEKKIKALQSFFINSLITETNKDTFNERVYFLDALSNMTSIEIDLISGLYQGDDFVSLEDGITIKGVLDPYVSLGFVNKLRSFGFIEQRAGGTVHLGAKDNALTNIIRISNYGKRFVEFCLEQN